MKRKNLLTSIVIVVLLVTFALPLFAVERADIDDKYKWKPEHIYASVEEWEADLNLVREGLEKLIAYKGSFAGENANDPVNSMKEVHKIGEELEIRLGHAWTYVMYNYHVDVANPEWMGRMQQLQFLWYEYGEKLAWMEPELLLIPEETMMKWIDENPDLEDYRKSFKDMYLQQEHVLSEQEEAILALSGNVTGTASDVFGKFTTADMTFDPIVGEDGEEIEVTDTGWSTWRTNSNRQVREDYFKSVWNGYDKYGTTLAALMAGNIKKDLYLMKARKYDNTLQRALKGNFIPEEVYINLVETTRNNCDALHRYNEIRKRMLGFDHYRHWDYYVDLVDKPEEFYTWEEGVEMVLDAMEPFGKDFIDELANLLDPESGVCDVYTSEGKRGGAYSSSCYGVHPYMLFNFDYEKGLTMNDVITVAHEGGHSMHTLLSEKNQPFPNKDYAIFNAEVASTVKQTLMNMKLLEEARKAYKKAGRKDKDAAKAHLVSLLVQNLGDARGTFFRQTMFATWEWEAHKMGEEGQPLTKESFDKLYGDLLAEFHGPAAEYEELSNVSWARIPHFYRGYYVYSYATSYASAVAIAKDIRTEHFGKGKAKKAAKGSTERYMNYLKSGSSKHPVDLLADAGVDMTTPAPIESFIAYFSDLVDELDELTKEK